MARVFLSYHWPDRKHVERVQAFLRAAGYDTFIDQRDLNPGQPWPLELEHALGSVDAVVVFVGHQIGGWQKREMWYALDRQSESENSSRSFAVVPILLPGSSPQRSFLFLNTWIDLRDHAAEGAALSKLTEVLRGMAGMRDGELAETCPYRGLNAFDEEDAPFFFGRDGFTETIVRMVRDEQRRFVAVVGPSGSGKSSVVKAGLIPALRRSRPPRPAWDVLIMRPGDDPFAGLVQAVLAETEPEATPDQLFNRIAETVRNLDTATSKVVEYLRVYLSRANGTDRLLLVIDQFEEMFTTRSGQDRSDRIARVRSFLEALFRAIEQAPLNVVITLRADYYEQALAISRELSDTMATSQIPLGPMTVDEIRSVIVEPAKMAGLAIDPGFVAKMIDDVRGSAKGSIDALPLLEYALTDLYERRSGRVLGYQQYDGIERVLADRAEALWNRLGTTRQGFAKDLLLKLVNVAESDAAGGDTKRAVALNQLSNEEAEVANEFAKAENRLVVTRGKSNQTDSKVLTIQGTVELVHEALIRHWTRFQSWLNADREFRLWAGRIENKQHDWERAGQPDALLLNRFDLRHSRAWIPARMLELLPNTQSYLDRSISRQRWLTVRAGVVSILMTCAIVLPLYYYAQIRQQEENAKQLLQKMGFVFATCKYSSAPGCSRLAPEYPEGKRTTIDLSLLNQVRGLREIQLTRAEVKDIEPIRNMTDLTLLDLSGTDVENVDALRGSTALKSLSLSRTPIIDISALKALTALEQLDLSCTKVTNIEALRELTRLKSLDLRHTKVTNLGPLERLTDLEHLDVSHTWVNDVNALKGLTHLRQLWLSDTLVRDLDLDTVKGMTLLEYLSVPERVRNRDAIQAVLPRAKINALPPSSVTMELIDLRCLGIP